MVDTLRDIPMDRAVMHINAGTVESHTLSTQSLTSNRDKVGKINENGDRNDRLSTFYIQTSPSKPIIPSSSSLNTNVLKPKSTAYKSKINMALTQSKFISETFPGINKLWNQTTDNFHKGSFKGAAKLDNTKIDENEMSKR